VKKKWVFLRHRVDETVWNYFEHEQYPGCSLSLSLLTRKTWRTYGELSQCVWRSHVITKLAAVSFSFKREMKTYCWSEVTGMRSLPLIFLFLQACSHTYGWYIIGRILSVFIVSFCVCYQSADSPVWRAALRLSASYCSVLFFNSGVVALLRVMFHGLLIRD